MGLANVQREIVGTIEGHHHVVVQFGVGGAILDGPVQVIGLAGDNVLASLQFVEELIDFQEVHAVLLQ